MSEPTAPTRTVSDNGSTLSDRVRSLSLSDRGKMGTPPSLRSLPWVLCGVCLAMTVAFGYRAYRVQPAAVTVADNGAAGRGTSADAGSGTTSVAATGEVVLQSKGYVVPIHLILVSPKVGGQLDWIDPRFEEGQIFKKGTPLARVETIDYAADEQQAKAAWEAAEQRLLELNNGNRPEEIEQAKHDLEESRRNFEQMRLDTERNKRAGVSVSPREVEQAQYGFEAMSARVKRLNAAYELMVKGPRDERKDAASAEVRQAKAAYEKAKWRLDNCQVVAPITGTILSKKAEVGNIVNPSAFSSGISASLCEMADLRELEIDLSIQERDVASVRLHQRCTIMPEAYQNHKPFLGKHPQGYVGYVSRLMPTADRAKGAIPVRVRIEKKDIPPEEAGVFLRPDMSALVSFFKDTVTVKPEGESR